MQYNSEANSQDIVNQTLWYCSASTTDYPINDLTRNANIAYHKAVVNIQSADGTWDYDDTNNTTLPIGTADLVSGQQDYALDDTMLELQRVEIKNSAGDWVLLKPTDQSEIHEAMSAYQSTDGAPFEYDKVGRSLFLYPAPNYASVAGLKVHFKRHANIFTAADNTKEPGFADAFHNIICLYTAREYCLLYKPERLVLIQNEIHELEAQMKKFYARRTKDVKTKLTPRRIYSR